MIKKILLLTVLCIPSLSVAEDNVANFGLAAAYQKATQYSPILKVEKARLEIAAGEAQQASAWLNPEFEFEMENFSGSGQFGGTDVAEYTYALAQKLEIGGKRSARSDAALKRLKAAQADYAVAERQMKKDVTVAYMKAVAAAQNLKLAEEQEDLAQTVLNTVKKRVEAAREPEIQQRKAEVAYATASLKRQQVAREAQLARTALATLWGDSLFSDTLHIDSFFKPVTPEDYQFYELQLAEAPQLQRYQSLINAQKAEADFERAQNVPDPTFRLGVKDFNENGEQALVAGLSFPLPVFNRNGGNIRKALSEVAAVEQQEHQARLLLTQQLSENWQIWQQAAQEAERLQASIIPTAEEAFKLAREGYDKGRFPYLEVLDAQRTLFDARAQYHDALIRMHTARAEVMAMTPDTQSPSTELKEQNNETTQ
jgi:cobalt-zinc-cadmium efflux system outer membrane protein